MFLQGIPCDPGFAVTVVRFLSANSGRLGKAQGLVGSNITHIEGTSSRGALVRAKFGTDTIEPLEVM
jgi:hypothetical protein